jgi:hypothetical protein
MSGPWDDFKSDGDGPWADFTASQAPKKPKGPPPSSFAMGLADPIHGGAQLLTKMLPQGVVDAGNQLNNWLADKTGMVARLPEGGVDQQVREREAAYKAQRDAAGETGMDWGRLGGNVLNPANLAIASRLPAAVSLAGRVGAGAAGGGLSSLMNPVTQGDSYAAEKAKQVALGSVVGGAVPGIAAGVGRVVAPKAMSNADLALLRTEGVQPTIGQSLGGRWSQAEEKLQSLPIVGDAIASARKRALEQFNNAAINRASGAVGQKVEGAGQKAVAEAGDVLSQAYDDALSSLKYVKFDGQFKQDASQLKQMAQSLTPDMRKQFESTLKNVVGGRTSVSGTMLADTFKKVESEIGQKAARYGKSAVASEQELGDALKQLQALLREQVARSDPAASEALKAANTGWANLVRVEGAAKAAKNNEGMFTPAQLNMAIQAADNSVRKRAVSRGDALMQDLGTAGQNVLGNRVADSGTAGRMMLGGGALGAGMMNPAIPVGLIGGAAMYSSPGQRLLTSMLLSRPQSAKAISGLLNQSSPMFAPAGGLLGLEMLNQ